MDNRPFIKRALFPEYKDSDELPLVKDIPNSAELIKLVHSIFGGRYRGLCEFLKDQYTIDVCTAFPQDPAQHQILEILRSTTAGRGFDPFTPVEIPVSVIEQRVQGDIHNALSYLQEKKLIASGRNGYRYYSPILHRVISPHGPTVFISHADERF